jgi:hypothetical protein
MIGQSPNWAGGRFEITKADGAASIPGRVAGGIPNSDLQLHPTWVGALL